MDPFGLEALVISGVAYNKFNGKKYQYEFIETGLAKVWDLYNEGEKVTWIIADSGWSDSEKHKFKEAVSNSNVNVLFIKNKDELINYINNKNKTADSNERSNDPITKFVVFSHGLIDNNGTIELGYHNSNAKELSLNTSDIDKISISAFSNPNSWFGSCRTGATGVNSFAQRWVNKVGGTTWAFTGKSDYEHINENRTWISAYGRRVNGFYWGGSSDYPIGGNNSYIRTFYRNTGRR